MEIIIWLVSLILTAIAVLAIKTVVFGSLKKAIEHTKDLNDFVPIYIIICLHLTINLAMLLAAINNSYWHFPYLFKKFKNMKLTRRQLIEIRSYNDKCDEWCNAINNILKENFDNIGLIDVTSSLHLIYKCNEDQLNFLECYGIKKLNVWSRNILNVKKDSHFFIQRYDYNNFSVCPGSFPATNLAHTYPTKEEAEKAALKFNTIQLMESWVKFYAPNWKPDWKDDGYKYGIVLFKNELISHFKRWETNAFIFQISVPTQELADKMLKEFEEDLKKIFDL